MIKKTHREDEFSFSIKVSLESNTEYLYFSIKKREFVGNIKIKKV